MTIDDTHEEETPFANEVLAEINRRLSSLTPRHRALAEYIMKNPESLAFLSITRLAREAGVSQATIVRFCNVLGYEGYAQLSREAQQSLQAELGTAGRFRLARRMQRETPRKSLNSAFEQILGWEIENLVNLSKSIKTSDFYRCIDLMTQADRICIVGCLSSSSLAAFFGDMLSKVFSPAWVLNGNGVRTSSVFRTLTSDSLVFLISFPPYARETPELGRMAAGTGAKIVTITNSNISPIIPMAALSFLIPSGIHSYLESYSAPIAFINALVAELGERNPERTQEALLRYDEYTGKADLYFTSRKQRNPQKTREKESR